ncbi:hypothetical protein [Streptomyces sp. NBC_00467]
MPDVRTGAGTLLAFAEARTSPQRFTGSLDEFRLIRRALSARPGSGRPPL